MGIIKKALHEFNLPARAREMGVPIWITPQFIFLIMGTIVVAVLLATRAIALQYFDPDVSFLMMLGLSMFLLIVTYVVVHAFEKVLEAKQSEAVKAKEVLALKDQFVFVAAHELRNPVNAIKWALELIASRRSAGSPTSSEDLHEVLERSADRLLALVHDLLEVARIESNAMQFSYGSYSAKLLCETMVSELSLQARKERKKVQCIIPHDAPKIQADEARLKEIINNLLSNALKFSPVGSEVQVSAKWDDSCLTVAVQDHGVGISEEDTMHVFEKFWRSAGSKKTEGTGLGLFIVKHMVEQMGGEIWFESALNIGTTFYVKLPRAV